jgi:TldD protein
MDRLGLLAIDKIKKSRMFGDLRIKIITEEWVVSKNGKPCAITTEESKGFGVRAFYNGSWGFSSSSDLTPKTILSKTNEAMEIAKATAAISNKKLQLANEAPYDDFWHTPIQEDPFLIPLSEKINFIMDIDNYFASQKHIQTRVITLRFRREEIFFYSTEGSKIRQVVYHSGGGYQLFGFDGQSLQRRSYPMPFSGQHKSGGFEVIRAMRLKENAEKISDELKALLKAPQTPSGKFDAIILGNQMFLQIHESVGHPTELDRVMGWEANFAGTSFVTREKLNKFQYGSKIVNLVSDNTIPGGLSTRGYDDEGVKAQRWNIVKDGIFTGYHTSRDTAHYIKEKRSRGSARSDGPLMPPIVRISNLSLLPGDATLEEMIADTKYGIIFDNNRSWSIDQRRVNFQFSTELAWEIKNGRITRMLKNPVYHDITHEFWNKCVAIGNESEWELWGVVNCGKGEPMQTAYMSHGSAPAKFRKINVGSN